MSYGSLSISTVDLSSELRRNTKHFNMPFTHCISIRRREEKKREGNGLRYVVIVVVVTH